MHLTFKLTAVDMVEDLGSVGSSIFSPCGDAIRLPKLLIIIRGLFMSSIYVRVTPQDL